ncbi:hypothetical protein OTU49_016768 [Cherax quadricarinatus]|uniref:Secreted protein n=1 Tax=Cherax quadricarinatus TaxID=27406 RepID=A0AAW0Y5T5_CHEQU
MVVVARSSQFFIDAATLSVVLVWMKTPCCSSVLLTCALSPVNLVNTCVATSQTSSAPVLLHHRRHQHLCCCITDVISTCVATSQTSSAPVLLHHRRHQHLCCCITDVISTCAAASQTSAHFLGVGITH